MKHVSLSLLFVTLFAFICSAHASAQSSTVVKGLVRDSVSGEAIPFVSVSFEGSKTGTVTNGKGEFTIQNKDGLDRVNITFIGYESRTIQVKKGKRTNLKVLLRSQNYFVEEGTTTQKAQIYTNDPNNPAMEWITQVIKNKKNNRIENNDYYQFEQYEKLALSVTELDSSMQDRKIFNKFKFIYNYIDTSEINNHQMMTFSVRETLSEEFRRRNPRSNKSIISAIRHEGIDKKLESESADALLTEGIKQVNIFDNEINLLFRRFVSPVSSTRATSFYRYYIADTLVYGDKKYIDLAFVPNNDQDMGFIGNMWISMDSTYSIRKVILKTPRDINLNFVAEMTITQEFEPLPDGQWAKAKEASAIEFSIFKVYYGIYAKNERVFKNYSITEKPPVAFGFNDESVVLDVAENQPDSVWEGHRLILLKKNESKVGSLASEFEKVPYYNLLTQLAQILLTNYAHTGKSAKASKFDLGPVWSIISRNDVEGYRFRLGGRTTASFNKNLFFKVYGAYGTSDGKFMYGGEAIYTFDPKKRHENEYRKNNLGFLYQYDIHTPGQRYFYTSPDNFFLSFKRGEADKMTYIRKGESWYEKEFASGFSWKLWGKSWDETATGSLSFLKENPEGQILNERYYNQTELGILLRFAFNEKFHQGRDSRLILKRDGPVFTLSQSFGLKDVFGSDYNYNFTELSVQKRFWLSGYGHLNLIARAGKLWGDVSFPLLILPSANQSYTIQPESYSMMNTLEFINDSYASLDMAYYLDGWLFNRIGFLRKFKLREIVSFKGLMGSLRPDNNPDNNKNLFLFPDDSYIMGKDPYMEVSFGIGNILKVLRVDYVRRLTYLHNANIDKNGIRATIDITF